MMTMAGLASMPYPSLSAKAAIRVVVPDPFHGSKIRRPPFVSAEIFSVANDSEKPA
jgi:hypothetical protein